MGFQMEFGTPFLRIYPKEPKTLIRKAVSTSDVHCCVICDRQDMEAAQGSINRWVDKITMGHLHKGILLGHEKVENFILCNTMDGPGEHYAKWNKPVRERQIPYDLIHMWNLMNKLK